MTKDKPIYLTTMSTNTSQKSATTSIYNPYKKVATTHYKVNNPCNKKSCVKIKKETPDTTSNTTTTTTTTTHIECSLLGLLRQMGFTDSEEALQAIRATYEDGNTQQESLDYAMLFIVTQREEMQEAKNIDYARQLSEQQKEEELKKIEANHVKTLHSSSLNDILTNPQFFIKNSIVLSFPQAKISFLLYDKQPQGKVLVIQYLTLEQKAIKWYGNILPYGYFKSCVNRIKLELKLLLHELELALFSLSEQNGLGVPKIFEQYAKERIHTDDVQLVTSNDRKRKRKHILEIIDVDEKNI